MFPLLIFIGVGAMIDFSPLLSQPKMVLLGAAGQFGIFGTLILATLLGFPLNQAASIGVIGAIDGPTAIYVSSKLAPELLAPIAVAAYSYMGLIPVIQIPIMRRLTTREERLIRMEYAPRPISRRALVFFPMAITVVAGLLVPDAVPLVATLMLGQSLARERGRGSPARSAENEIVNVSTLFLGLVVGSTMAASTFLQWQTLGILALGLLAFVLDTAAGLMFGKLMSVLSGRKINPLIGAAGHQRFSHGRPPGGPDGSGRGL